MSTILDWRLLLALSGALLAVANSAYGTRRRFGCLQAIMRGGPPAGARVRDRGLHWGRLAVLWGLSGLSGCQPQTSSRPHAHPSFQISSSSMAPSLWGPMLSARCEACGRISSIAMETYRPSLPCRCYSCGGLAIVASEQTPLPGQVVNVQPASQDHILRRFEIVVAETAGVLQVKRIWGLPGEELALRQGDLWIDSQVLQKSLDELRQVAVPVSSLQNPAEREWSILQKAAGQKTEAARELADRRTPAIPLRLRPGMCLQWRYWQPSRIHPQETAAGEWLAPARLNDDYVFNQGVAHVLQETDDMLIELELAQELQGPMRLQSEYRGAAVQLHLLPVQWSTPDQSDTQGTIELSVRLRKSLAIALCDGRLLVQSDSEQHILNAPQTGAEAKDALKSSTPDQAWFDLWSEADQSLAELRVARDVVLRPAGRGGRAEWQLGPDAYFLIGDNLPASEDSRAWQIAGIPRARIVGCVEPTAARIEAFSLSTFVGRPFSVCDDFRLGHHPLTFSGLRTASGETRP